MPHKPTSAFSFQLAGGIVTLLIGILLLALFEISSANISSTIAAAKAFQNEGYNIPIPTTSISGVFGVFAVTGVYTPYIGIISGVLMIIISFLMYSPEIQKVKKWSKLAIVFLLISLLGGAGFGLGFVLGLIGIALGIRYNGQ